MGWWVSLLVWRAVRKDAISSLPAVWVACAFLGGASNGLDGSGSDGGGKWQRGNGGEEGVVAGLDVSPGTPPSTVLVWPLVHCSPEGTCSEY